MSAPGEPALVQAASRPLVYYGWVNVVMGALAMTATLPGRTHGLGLITKPLLDDLQMQEQVFSSLNFWAILLGTLFAWPIAWLIDRWGTRLVGGGDRARITAMTNALQLLGSARKLRALADPIVCALSTVCGADRKTSVKSPRF
jgi:hypothetical protein